MGRLAALISKFDSRCVYCASLVEEGHTEPAMRATRDHSVPKTRGGLSGDDNIVLSCESCNVLKSDMTAYEFRYFIMKGEFTKSFIIYLAKHRQTIHRTQYARLRLKMLSPELLTAIPKPDYPDI